jgi:multiple sugar transport system permease protein
VARSIPATKPWLNDKRREAIAGYLFILPVYIGFITFILIPIFRAAGISLTRFDILGGSEFIGLENYKQMLSDMRLRTVYGNTIVFTVFAVFFNTAVGLILAVFLNQKMPAAIRNLFRSIYFFPILVAHTYIATIWQYLYQQDTGIINYYLGFLGIDPIPWLSNTRVVMVSVIILDVWKNAGFAMLIFLAGLQNIPQDYYEAAELDGASDIQRFFRITLPLLSPTIFFILVIFMIGALQVFDTIIVLTQGGPGDSSRSIVMYIYEQAFQRFDMGYAAALSMTLFVIIMILTLIQFRFSSRWVHYD